MFGDRRNPFPNPAKELEFNLIRHGLRMHYDSLMMLSSGLRMIGSGGGAAQLAWQIEHVADRICADLDALEAMLPESLDEHDAEHDAPQDVPPRPSDEGDSPRADRA
jgi:hypothetical protein